MRLVVATIAVSLVYKDVQYNCSDKIDLPVAVYDSWLKIGYCKAAKTNEKKYGKSGKRKKTS